MKANLKIKKESIRLPVEMMIEMSQKKVSLLCTMRILDEYETGLEDRSMITPEIEMSQKKVGLCKMRIAKDHDEYETEIED